MTEKRRGPGRPPGSKNKNITKKTAPKNRTSRSRVTGSNKNSKGAVAEKTGLNDQVKDEIVAVLLIAVGVFMAVAFQTSAAGAVGMSLSRFFKGCFGFAAYILPYYFIIYGILLFAKKTIHTGIKSVILLTMIFLMISLINSARFINPITGAENMWNISYHYNNGMVLDSGGAFGMAAGGLIVKLLGIPGLYILSSVVIIICLLLLMNTPVSRFLEEIKTRKQHRAVLREEHLREKELQKQEKMRQMEMEMKLDMNSAGEFGENTQRGSSKITDSQRNILNYVSKESFPAEQNIQEEEQLDFSLGENNEKHRKGRRKKNIIRDDVPSEIEDTAESEAVRKMKEPVIIGGFSPKAMEEKLTKAEAARNTLKEEDFNIHVTSTEAYEFPPIDLLRKKSGSKNHMNNEQELRAKAIKLENTLRSFNIDARVTNVTQGPTVTRYEVHPNVGVKVSGITNLANDIALNMEAKSIRIEAPIPGKPAVGIEIENEKNNMVTIREIIDSAAFKKAESKISFAVGKDIEGNAIVTDLKSMPHLLIAGSTGSGKSVCINSIIISMLYKATPDEVKLVLIDPKVVELANYNGIPHLLIPVVTEPTKAAAALNWAVAEMDERYRKFASEGVREISSYNKTVRAREEDELIMPQVVIIIDELADLMMVAKSQVEEAICRLAQKARAAGMHLIVATQRPSTDVVTGLIKANIPSRIAFAVSSHHDSMTILDMSGAEKLVGKGDMLFNPLGSGKPIRVQGTFISDDEVNDVIEFVKSRAEETGYSNNVMDTIERANMAPAAKNDRDAEDELLPEAIELVVDAQQASVSMLQRRFRIGYNRAARIIDMMEDRQIIGPSDGSRPRQVLISEAELNDMKDETEDLELQ